MDAYIGEIRLFAGNFPPMDWQFCEGQSLSVTQNPALYSVIGNTYGGTPGTTFMLPDLRGKVPMGVGAGPGLTSRALGNNAGSPGASVTLATMPAHTHTVQGKKTPLTTFTNDPTNHTWTSLGAANPIYASTSNVAMNPNAVSSTTVGGSNHNNIQPCVGIHYIICIYGTYPVPPA